MTKERLTYVDTAKFLAIWMVIVSHSCMHSDVARFFFAFHVPMFFFLYGFVYKEKDNRLSAVSYLKNTVPKLFGRILVPYLLLAFILGEGLGLRTLPFVLWGSLQSLVGVSSTHLWFLPCYFIAVLLFGLLFETLPKFKWTNVVRGGVILTLTVISALLNSESGLSLALRGYEFYFTGIGANTAKSFYIGFPFALNVALSGMAFIYAGYLVRKLFDRIDDRNWILVLLAVLSAVIGVILFFLNKGNERLLAMSYAQYGDYLLFIAAAILLSIAALVLSKYVDNSLFAKFGQYTLAIYGFHLVLAFIGNKFVNVVHITEPNLIAVIKGTITLALSCLMIPVIRYIDPYILGERKK